MKKLSLTGFLLALTCAVAFPAFAGSVYVPLATDRVVGPYQYLTEITVSNRSGSEDRRFTTFFITENAVGTTRPPGSEHTTLLPAGVSNVFGLGLEGGASGMLEVDGPAQITTSARLLAMHDGEVVDQVVLPIISSDNVLRGGTVAHLQNWGRDTQSGLVTDFGMINLSSEAASCEIDVHGADGSEMTPTVLLPLNPLTHVQFEDALGILAADGIDLARISVSCNRDFYIYSLRYNLQTGALAFQTPSGTGASTLGIAPPVQPNTCPQASTCFETAGIFHTPNPANPVKRLSYSPPAGNYSRLFASLEVRNGGWFPGNVSGTHNIFWLVRDKNRDMFGYVNVRGPNTNDLFVRHGFNQSQGEKARLAAPFQFPVGATYRFEYVYDTAARLVDLTVFNENNTPIFNLRGVPNINTISFGGGQKILVDFGFPLGLNPNEPPTYGWDYKNMFIELTP